MQPRVQLLSAEGNWACPRGSCPRGHFSPFPHTHVRVGMWRAGNSWFTQGGAAPCPPPSAPLSRTGPGKGEHVPSWDRARGPQDMTGGRGGHGQGGGAALTQRGHRGVGAGATAEASLPGKLQSSAGQRGGNLVLGSGGDFDRWSFPIEHIDSKDPGKSPGHPLIPSPTPRLRGLRLPCCPQLIPTGPAGRSRPTAIFPLLCIRNSAGPGSDPSAQSGKTLGPRAGGTAPSLQTQTFHPQGT